MPIIEAEGLKGKGRSILITDILQKKYPDWNMPDPPGFTDIYRLMIRNRAIEDMERLESLSDEDLAAESMKVTEEWYKKQEELREGMRRLAARVSHGIAHENKQMKFRIIKAESAKAKHEQWRRWQAEIIANNEKFADQSKLEQAKRLKKKYSISDSIETIAKRLSPLPSPKDKK